MTIHFEEGGKKLLVFLSGEIDHYVAGKISEKIDNRLENKSYTDLVFDFKNVSFMDSSGIGMVAGRIKRMESRKGAVTIVNCNTYVKKILHMAGIFTIANYGGNENE